MTISFDEGWILRQFEIKKINKTRYLEKRFGGKWRKHRGISEWYREDSVTDERVCAVADCSCDDDCGHYPAYYHYETGKSSYRIYWD